MLKDEYARYVSAAFANTTYGQWMRSEGVRVHQDWYVEDVWKLEMGLWPRLGCQAVFIALYPMMEGQRGMYFAEIPPGGSVEPIRHLFEQMICILDGRGATEIWQEGDAARRVFEWGRGSLFSPPLNTWYRMFNLGQEPVRFLAINRAPAAMNEFQSADFVLNCPYVFRDRYRGEEGYFTPAPRTTTDSRGLWETNFIPNLLETDLDEAAWKVAAGALTGFRMAGNQMAGHLSEWPVGRYHKAHYHGAGALLLGLRSEGYVLLWSSDLGTDPYSSGDEREVVEIPWGRGSLYSPPSEWFHQHFNTGREPARHLAVRGGNAFSGALLGSLVAPGPQVVMTDVREGGTLIEYEAEDPEIRRRYQEAVERRGVACAMPDVIYQSGYAQSLRPQDREGAIRADAFLPRRPELGERDILRDSIED